MKKLLITKQIPQVALDILEKQDYQLTIHTHKNSLDQAALIKLCKQHDALLSVGTNQLDAIFFNECAHLKGVALMSVGYDNVDVDAAINAGVPFSNTPDVLSKATADIAFLLMLAVSRNAFYMYRAITEGKWGSNETSGKLGIELYGKTLGIFGLGRIGFEFAEKCKAMYQMKIIYHNRKENAEAAAPLNARYVSFNELLQEADVISVHANLSDSTKGIFNAEAFSKMKRNSIFINTARGPLHNEDDLIAALKNKRIWGAGLDVTQPEPMLQNNPLLTLENVCILPHLGSATVETRTKMAVMAAENIVAALEGLPMPQVVNKKVYGH